MQRKPIDVNMLKSLAEASKKQEIANGGGRSTDSNFPVFSTPIDKKLLVYIPTTNVIDNNGVQTYNFARAFVHPMASSDGKRFGSIRCMSQFPDEALLEQLGYKDENGIKDDPACVAEKECWDLANLEVSHTCEAQGITRENNEAAYKAIAKSIYDKRCVKGAEETIVFPICIIPTLESSPYTINPDGKIVTQYVVMKKGTYDKKIAEALTKSITQYPHMAGLFWLWDYSYKGNGKANARDCAKDATYEIIKEADFLNNPTVVNMKNIAEENAKLFTTLKAYEVIKAIQFVTYEDAKKEVESFMAQTRALLASAAIGGTALPASAPTTSAANVLAQFGTEGNMGVAPTTEGVSVQPIGVEPTAEAVPVAPQVSTQPAPAPVATPVAPTPVAPTPVAPTPVAPTPVAPSIQPIATPVNGAPVIGG